MYVTVPLMTFHLFAEKMASFDTNKPLTFPHFGQNTTQAT